MASFTQGLVAAALVLALVTVSQACMSGLQDCTSAMLADLQDAQRANDKEMICKATNDAVNCFNNLDCGSDYRAQLDEVVANARKQLADAGCKVSGASSLSPLTFLSGLLVLVAGYFLKY